MDTMSERIYWIKYKGKKILFVDFSGIQDEETYLRAIEQLEAEYLKQPVGHSVPTLIDSTGSVVTPAVTARSRQMIATMRSHGVPSSGITAVVGVSGFQKAIVQAMRFVVPGLYPADTIEAAKDWLVEQIIKSDQS